LADWPDFDTLARQLHSTASTLRRKLRQEDHTYQSIKDNLRRDLAINHLSGSNRSIEEIAVQLGFADPSAFHRAFKKWTGNSPGEHRRTLSGKSRGQINFSGSSDPHQICDASTVVGVTGASRP
jgi:AraC-like DNA-binding protein